MAAERGDRGGRGRARPCLDAAIAHHRAGRLEPAVAGYREALRHDRRLVEAQSNLGAALRALGRTADAVAAFGAAVALAPDEPRLRINLGNALLHGGDSGAGCEALAAAHRLAPDAYDTRDRLVAALRRSPPATVGPELAAALDRLAADPAIDLAPLARTVVRRATGDPTVAAAVAALRDGTDPDAAAGDRLFAALAAPAFTALCRDHVIADPAIEALFTGLRSRWLGEAMAPRHRAPPLPAVVTVALQMQATEWLAAPAAAEAGRLDDLAARLADPAARIAGEAPSFALLVYALFRPLAPFRDDATLRRLAGRDDVTGDLLRRHLIEPEQEAAIAAALPRLTAPGSGVAAAVRAQYEASPYPRWRRLPRRTPEPVGAVLAAALDDPELAAAVTMTAPRVLVAGCGTGRHACLTATRFAGAEVLAVDLSRASLAYAVRQARSLGIANVTFAEADIGGLDALGRRFDVVECSGVLHHMADPEAGWRSLRAVLAPGGLMRIALYSARARAGLDDARRPSGDADGPVTADTIRAARARIRALPADAPARLFAESADFFSLSGCRDMLFPAHEDRFTLPRIAAALAALDLSFLGFELPDPNIRALYRRMFPADAQTRDLANWDRLEAARPTLFAAMYQFWCRAAA